MINYFSGAPRPKKEKRKKKRKEKKKHFSRMKPHIYHFGLELDDRMSLHRALRSFHTRDAC